MLEGILSIIIYGLGALATINTLEKRYENYTYNSYNEKNEIDTLIIVIGLFSWLSFIILKLSDFYHTNKKH